MRKAVVVAALAAIAFGAGAVQAGPSVGLHSRTTENLQRLWLIKERQCHQATHEAGDAVCLARDAIVAELEHRGWCWAYRDMRVAPPDYAWHPCSVLRPKGWKPSKDDL